MKTPALKGVKRRFQRIHSRHVENKGEPGVAGVFPSIRKMRHCWNSCRGGRRSPGEAGAALWKGQSHLIGNCNWWLRKVVLFLWLIKKYKYSFVVFPSPSTGGNFYSLFKKSICTKCVTSFLLGARPGWNQVVGLWVAAKNYGMVNNK